LKKFVSVVFAVLLIFSMASAVFAEETESNYQDVKVSMTNDPVVTFRTLNSNGEGVEGTVVTVNKIGDTTESSEIVFQGTSDSNATVEFKPEISDDQLAADVTDVVYEVFFVSPKGEIERKFFSVPFVKNGQKVLLSDKEVIEKDQNVTVESNFTGKEPVEENGNRNTPTATASYISCKPICTSVNRVDTKNRENYAADRYIRSHSLGVEYPIAEWIRFPL